MKFVRLSDDWASAATRSQLHELLRGFVIGNEKPTTSPNYSAQTTDRMDHIVGLFDIQELLSDCSFVLLLLKVRHPGSGVAVPIGWLQTRYSLCKDWWVILDCFENTYPYV